MNRSFLRRRYRNLHPVAQRIFLYEHFRTNVAALTEAVRRSPKTYALRHALADALLRANRRSEARRIWFQTTRLFPRAPNPFFQLANWAMEHGRFDEAEKRLRQCLVLDRGYFEETAHFWRAESLFRLGRFDEAIFELGHVRDDFEEMWFLQYRSRSKSDILNDIACAKHQ